MFAGNNMHLVRILNAWNGETVFTQWNEWIAYVKRVEFDKLVQCLAMSEGTLITIKAKKFNPGWRN